MRHLVLVIDDQFHERRDGYKRLAEKVSELPGFELNLNFVEHPNQIKSMIHQNHYSAAIVDAVLIENWPEFHITKVLKILGNEIPIALISGQWDETNAEEIDEAWKKPNCRTFLHWRDIDPVGNGQIDYAVRAFISMLADREKLDIHLNLNSNDPIRILHISDVQTGGVDNRNIKLEANRCADSILTHWKECPPTFVAFTGDVAEHASPSQYKLAQDWIEYFFERLGLNKLPARNLLYVPGNHDVNLKLAAASRVKVASDNDNEKLRMSLSGVLQEAELLGYSYIPFRNFLTAINDCPLLTYDVNDYSLAWVESRYRHLGIVLYGVNTAQPVSAFGLPDRKVDSDALARITEELNQVVNSCGDTPPLVIGLGHHCPVSASADSAVKNPEDFEKFFRGRVKTGLFLHGHTHEHDLSYSSNDDLRLVRSCATTLTKKEDARPSDSLRGFNLLELGRENNIVKSLKAFSFGWLRNNIKELKKGAWVLHDDGMFREEH